MKVRQPVEIPQSERIRLPSDYFEARKQFLTVAQKVGAVISSCPIAARGPRGEELFIDFARIGPADSETVYMSLSGVHGVEGKIGSAIQCALLSQLPRLPAGSAFFFCHALNPYGYVHRRRVNENNVDLNRNCFLEDRDFGQRNPDYQRLRPFLTPDVAKFSPRKSSFYVRALWEILKAGGIAPIKRALTLGQYEFPDGLYFGGRERQESLRIFVQHVEREWKSSKKILGIDLHSGLGTYGESTVLVCNGADQDLLRSFQAGVPGLKVEAGKPQQGSVGIETSGDIGAGVGLLFPGRRVLWVTQEIGTFDQLEMFRKLRAENVSYRSRVTDPEHPSRLELEAAFSPADPKWYDGAVRDGIALMQACVALG